MRQKPPLSWTADDGPKFEYLVKKTKTFLF
jgi:hypothetical protein